MAPRSTQFFTRTNCQPAHNRTVFIQLQLALFRLVACLNCWLLNWMAVLNRTGCPGYYTDQHKPPQNYSTNECGDWRRWIMTQRRRRFSLFPNRTQCDHPNVFYAKESNQRTRGRWLVLHNMIKTKSTKGEPNSSPRKRRCGVRPQFIRFVV